IGGYTSPVCVRADRRDRAVAVSALAAEIATAQGTILWVGAQQVARPLAWLPLRERRMDARPLRVELGESPWPGVNPFDLDSDLLAAWLCAEIEPFRALPVARVREAIEHARSIEAGAQVRRAALPFSEAGEWLVSAGLPVPTNFSFATRPAAVRERTDLSFPSGSLTVICGHGQDLRDRAAEITLAVLAFISAARDSGHIAPRLIVLDGVWASLAGKGQGAIAQVLLDFVGRGDGYVLIADELTPELPVLPAWESLLIEVEPGARAGDLAIVRVPGGRTLQLCVPTPAGLEDA